MSLSYLMMALYGVVHLVVEQSSSSQAGGGATVMAVKKKVKPTTMVGEGAVGEKRPADVLAKAGGEESGQPLAKQSRAE